MACEGDDRKMRGLPIFVGLVDLMVSVDGDSNSTVGNLSYFAVADQE